MNFAIFFQSDSIHSRRNTYSVIAFQKDFLAVDDIPQLPGKNKSNVTETDYATQRFCAAYTVAGRSNYKINPHIRIFLSLSGGC